MSRVMVFSFHLKINTVFGFLDEGTIVYMGGKLLRRDSPLGCSGNGASRDRFKRASALFVVHVFEQEAGVLELFGLGLGLAQGVEAHAGDNQDRGTTERQLGVEAEGHDQHGRDQGHEQQVDGADGVESVHHVGQITAGGVAARMPE